MKIDQNSIMSITNDYDYDNKNMPVLYIGLRCVPDDFDLILKNKENAQFVFTLYSHDVSKQNSIQKTSLHDTFSYMMTSDPNYVKSMDTMDTSDLKIQKAPEGNSYVLDISHWLRMRTSMLIICLPMV